MKKLNKRLLSILLVGIISIVYVLSLTGCTSNYMTKNLGGSTTLELPENVKLEDITWKDNSLWYLTRPMRKDEEAETHTFKQQSEYGVFEGTITIIEKKKTD